MVTQRNGGKLGNPTRWKDFDIWLKEDVLKCKDFLNEEVLMYNLSCQALGKDQVKLHRYSLQRFLYGGVLFYELEPSFYC